MRFLRFSQRSRNLYRLPGIDFAQLFIAFIVLLFSLTVHESAHAWTADRLGDPTARLLGRVSLNPIVHADLIGTVVFPLLAMIGGVPLIGWAKPVPFMPQLTDIDRHRLRPADERSRCRSMSVSCGMNGATTCWSRRPVRRRICCWQSWRPSCPGS